MAEIRPAFANDVILDNHISDINWVDVDSMSASIRLRFNVGGSGQTMIELEGENLGGQWCQL